MSSENSVAAQALNERNNEFWLAQSQLRDRRLSDAALAAVAMRRVHSEAATGVPIRWRASLEQALAEAETLPAENRIRGGGCRPPPFERTLYAGKYKNAAFRRALYLFTR